MYNILKSLVHVKFSYILFVFVTIVLFIGSPLELHLTTSELWFGQEQEGILP